MTVHNIARILDQYAAPSIQAMAKSRGVAVKGGKADNLFALSAVVSDAASVKRVYDVLRTPSKVLLALLRDYGGETTIQQLSVTAKILGMADFDDHLHALMRHALVLYNGSGFNKYEIWNPGGSTYGMPDSRAVIFALPEALALAKFKVTLPAPDQKLDRFEGMPAQISDQSPSIVLHALYLVVRRAATGKLTFTQQGRLAKPALKALAKELGGDEKWALFLCYLGTKVGLLNLASGILSATPESDAFFARGPSEQIETLFKSWLLLTGWSEFNRIPEIATESEDVPDRAVYSYYYGDADVPTAERLTQARAFLVGLLRRAGIQSEWYSLEAFQALAKSQDVNFLIPRGGGARSFDKDKYTGIWRAGGNRWNSDLSKSTHWEIVEGGFIREVLRGPLQWFGLVQIGGNEKGEVVAFRPTPAALSILGLAAPAPEPAQSDAAARKALVVQPNFEIVAYTDPEFLQILFQLEQFAERVSYERVAHYKLTRDSVYRGLQSGVTASAMRDFLIANSRNELPQNIAYSLGDWQKVHDRVHLYRATTLLEASSKAELDRALQKIAPCTITRLSPLWALVPSEEAPAIKRMLSVLDGTVTLDYAVPVKRAFEIDDALCINVPKPNLDMWLRARLEQFSDPTKEDPKTARFQMTREAFKRGAALGLKAEDVLAFLRDLGPDPLPADVSLTIGGWGGKIEPVALSGTVALVAQYGLISALSSVEEIRELLWLDVNETVALVRQEDVPALRAALERRGINFEANAESHLSAPARRRKPNSIKSHFPTHRRIVSKAQIQAAGPKMKVRKTDAIEIGDLRPYPRATMVKMFDNAIAKSVCVVIDYDGKSRRVIRTIEPIDIYKEHGVQYVDAMDRLTGEPRQFRVDRIVAMQVTNEEFESEL